jgi:hypothetical protein
MPRIAILAGRELDAAPRAKAQVRPVEARNQPILRLYAVPSGPRQTALKIGKLRQNAAGQRRMRLCCQETLWESKQL